MSTTNITSPVAVRDQPLLSLRNLDVAYRSRGFRKPPAHIIRDVSVDIHPGEIVGLVGESGSGKTTLGRAVLGLAPVVGGEVIFDGQDISGLTRRQRRPFAKDIQVIFQDPYSSLNPALTIEEILAEPLLANGEKTGRETVRDLLDKVHLPRDAGRRLAREFSGGQRQRIAIARALALNPRLIICDEPTSALDLSTQARIVDLLLELQERTGVAMLFITHDLDVVRVVSHRIAVMLHGEIVETGPSAVITSNPQHPYTQRLLMAAPVPDPKRQAERRESRRQLAQS
ncbi:ATP-binding cassette domain-containing protein [Microbacterium saperdae]|uniref:Peptide/nickel transport system ATP-binding protein n=1 Tax=Microbacterium saperdae TaxID=69368 RepID=A0A543BL59_9MICO|nr:ATP-binding cassette domain-containing protein [Microbacterium saperdae]TQL85559.1 peptide/nickel transport system ATP-binding protein [Microbacterium saperdae]GGM62822.1 ABC transporter ATP-binding protein [Microbacterium saperdae]